MSLFALVVFLADGFFTVAAFLVVGAFLGATGFLVVTDLAAGVFVLVMAAFFGGAALVVSVDFFAEEDFLDGGLAFYCTLNKVSLQEIMLHASLESADTLGRLGASLTLPDGPLGNTNVSFSAPRVSAKLS